MHSKISKHRGVVHKQKRQADFLKLFDTPTYQIPSSLKASADGRLSEFYKNSEKMYTLFHKKWHTTTKRVEYTNTFSLNNWKALDDADKSKHTLSNCDACFNQHEDLQRSFPGKPLYSTASSITLDIPHTPHGGFTKRHEKDIGRRVLKDLDNIWVDQFGNSLTTSVPKTMSEANLVAKDTKTKKIKIVPRKGAL